MTPDLGLGRASRWLSRWPLAAGLGGRLRRLSQKHSRGGAGWRRGAAAPFLGYQGAEEQTGGLCALSLSLGTAEEQGLEAQPLGFGRM